MKNKRQTKIPLSVLEKHLLSTFYSGIYLTIKDIVTIGKKIDIELDYKKSSLILQILFIKAKESNRYKDAIALFISLFKQKRDEYKEYLQNYPNAKNLNLLIHKVNTSIKLLQKELAGNPYE